MSFLVRSLLIFFLVWVAWTNSFVRGTAMAADVTMAWDKDVVEEDLEGFKIYCSADPETGFELVEAINDPAARQYTHTGVEGPHWWYVTAFDTSGNESGPSNIVDNTVPGPWTMRICDTIK